MFEIDRIRRLRIVEYDRSDIGADLSPMLEKMLQLGTETVIRPLPRTRLRGTQRNAKDLLPDLMESRRAEGELALGITDQDIYVPELNFVFGLADPGSGAGVISLCRLRHKDRGIFLERCLKEAVHEIGHLLTLGHCRDPICVMHFSNSLMDTDLKSYRFCPRCEALLRRGPSPES